MIILSIVLVSLVSAFVGFAIGRLGDKYWGHMNNPHHWIYGVLLVIAGIVFIETWIGIAWLSFGVGLFVSDLNDFLHLRFWSPDEPKKWKFWSIM